VPNFIDYHESVGLELDAVKNRIRNLVTNWVTDGEWKEAALRTLLRGRLPAGTLVGRGFIVDHRESSTQIDLFVLKHGKPTLFRDGELAIVTPDVPGAIVEVKTRVAGPRAWREVVTKLAKVGQICKKVNNEPWLGVFAYEGGAEQRDHIADAVCSAYSETKVAINCVTCGYDVFARSWRAGESESGKRLFEDTETDRVRIYGLERLSPAYFTSNLVATVCDVHGQDTAWFAHPEGKAPHMIAERKLEA